MLYESDIGLAAQILTFYPETKLLVTSLDHSVWFSESHHEINANNWYLLDVHCISSVSPETTNNMAR